MKNSLLLTRKKTFFIFFIYFLLFMIKQKAVKTTLKQKKFIGLFKSRLYIFEFSGWLSLYLLTQILTNFKL